MYLKSDAIVVSRTPVLNTSLMLRLYTRQFGMLSALAKGAFRRRSKAEPASVPDLFARGEVVLWLGPRRETAILREWSLDEPRLDLREDWDRFRAAAACAALASALSWHEGAGGDLFDLLDRTLEELDRGGRPRPLVWAFCLRVFRAEGLLAGLECCAACGAAEAVGIAPASGGLVCGRCRPDEGQVMSLPPEAVSAARYLAGAPLSAAARLSVSDRAAAALERAVRLLVEHHIERPLPELAPARRLAEPA